MTPEKIQHLKEVLSIPTKTYQETLMIEYLDKYFTEKGYDHTIDQYGNVYVTKGEADVYPCVIAHTDTVHSITEMVVEEEQLPNVHGELKDSFKAYHAVTGNPVGIGGDDKCGVYSCLDVLEQLPVIKAAFFVSEETGCHGSRKASPEFFSNTANEYVVIEDVFTAIEMVKQMIESLGHTFHEHKPKTERWMLWD